MSEAPAVGVVVEDRHGDRDTDPMRQVAAEGQGVGHPRQGDVGDDEVGAVRLSDGEAGGAETVDRQVPLAAQGAADRHTSGRTDRDRGRSRAGNRPEPTCGEELLDATDRPRPPLPAR